MNLPLREVTTTPFVETRNASVHKVRVAVGAPENQEEKDIVVKEWKWVRDKPRNEGESDKEYYARRMEDSLQYIKKERESQEKAVAFLGMKGIRAPREHYVIAQDDQGYPYPIKLQEFAKGTPLAETTREDWSDKQVLLLYNIILANRECYARTGKCLDLIGSAPGNRERANDFERFLHPFRNSTNILLTDDGEVAVIDPYLSHSQGLKQFIKWISFEKEYVKLVAADLYRMAKDTISQALTERVPALRRTTDEVE